MLKQETLDLASGIADALSKKNVVLAPVNNTFLFDLYASSEDAIYSTTNADTEHDLLQDKLIELLSRTVTAQVSMIRSEVVPVVNDIYGEIKNTLNDYLNNDFVGSINIVQKDIHDFLSSQDWQDLVKRHYIENVVSPAEPRLKVVDDAIMDRVREAATAYTSQNTSALVDIIEKLNASHIFSVLRTSNTELASGDNHSNLDRILPKLILNETIKNHEDLGLELYDVTSINQLRDYLNNNTKFLVTLAENNRKIAEQKMNPSYGLLVLSIDRNTNTIYVNGPVYRKFLEDGNDNSILYGLLVNKSSNPSDYSLPSILNNKEKLLNYFNSYLKLSKTNTELNLFNSFKSFFTLIFNSHLANRSKFEDEYINTHPGAIEFMHKQVQKLLANVRLNDISDEKNLFNTVMTLVTKSRFFYTDAYKILTYMQNESQDDMEPQMAAAIAATFYLVDYFMEQVNIYNG